MEFVVVIFKSASHLERALGFVAVDVASVAEILVRIFTIELEGLAVTLLLHAIGVCRDHIIRAADEVKVAACFIFCRAYREYAGDKNAVCRSGDCPIVSARAPCRSHMHPA